MKLILPETIDDTTLAATNVAETLDEYNPATSYSEGDKVRDDATHHAFESLEDANMGNPLTDASKWLDLGPTNPWAMFDQKVGTITSNADTIEVTVVPAGRATGLAAFNLAGASVSVTVTDTLEGVIYDETFILVSNANVGDYYDYCFEPIIRKTELLVDDLPPVAGADIDVVIDNTGGNAACGGLVLGSLRELGVTVYGSGFGIIDYSRKEPDDFGNIDLVQRDYRSTGRFDVVVPRLLVDEVKRVLTARRAIPTVFSGTSEYGAMLIYGFPRDWSVSIDHYQNSRLNIELESLT